MNLIFCSAKSLCATWIICHLIFSRDSPVVGKQATPVKDSHIRLSQISLSLLACLLTNIQHLPSIIPGNYILSTVPRVNSDTLQAWKKKHPVKDSWQIMKSFMWIICTHLCGIPVYLLTNYLQLLSGKNGDIVNS